MGVRVAKFIADSGVASRRGAEELIAAGHVRINGVVIDSPVNFVGENDTVEIDGKKISARTDTELYMFHKPINTMTTLHDPRGRKTIYDCLGDEYKNLKYVGRLDYKTTGLLLLTNDGDFARKLTLPSSNIERTYIATVNSTDFSHLDKARHGMVVDGIKYAPMKIEEIGGNDLRITITEGKKNEVRIVLRACGCPVRKLHRISYGKIRLGKLPVGKIQKISQKTIDLMKKSF
ncbi:MAG: rRNA pseudouridine synthase [Alphaproteobacteria bacterium]|jgi:23S rRNA pseudouridine2605 synthase|nr:rRNA pseudouridine synthase [Alphaproteobacteria bacterium]